MTQNEGTRLGQGRLSLADPIFRLLLGAAVILAGLLLATLIVSLIGYSMPLWTVENPLHFITSDVWSGLSHAPDGSTVGGFGAAGMIFGTVVTSIIAILFAAPVGIFAAVYLVEFAPKRLATLLTFLVELIAAIPSVVIGLWAVGDLSLRLRDSVEWWVASSIGKIIPWLSEDPAAPAASSVFRAGLVLGMMILPMVVAVSREVIRSVPQSLREGYVGMGATRWETIRHVILPTAKVGIAGAVLLALGRAIGETIAVTMVIGNASRIPGSLFQSGQTIASKIAGSIAETGTPEELGSLAALGLALFLITLGLSLAVRFITRRSVVGANS